MFSHQLIDETRNVEEEEEEEEVLDPLVADDAVTVVDLITQSTSVDLIKQNASVDLSTQNASVDLITQSASVDLIKQNASVDLSTQNASVDLSTQNASVDLITQSAPTTDYDDVKPSMYEDEDEDEDEDESEDEDEDNNSGADTAAADATAVDREMPLSWSCCYCVKEFDNRWSLARHEKIHTGEKPYKCHICDKEFIQKCSLRRHVKIHSDDKPFVCIHPNCGKRFKLKEYLDMHRRVHLSCSSSSGSEPVVEEDYDRGRGQSLSIGGMMENNSMASNEDRALIHQLHFRMYRMSIVYGEQLGQYQMKEQQLILALHECAGAFGAVVSELIAQRGIDNIPIDILLVARRFCPHLGL